MYNRARVYRSGELEVVTVLTDACSPPPAPVYGPKFTRGPSARFARGLRRAVIALCRETGRRALMLTLTAQDHVSDEDMGRYLESFLAWGRKFAPKHFEFYAWVGDLQARGVVHYHLLLLVKGPLPRKRFLQMRRLWAEVYGMGPGSFDAEWMRSAKGAAAYVSRLVSYVTKRGGPEGYRLGLDGDGSLSWEPWRRSRHSGQWYERVTWRGRSGDMSRALRSYSGVVLELAAEWGAFPSLTLRGRRWFHATSEEAEDHLRALLDPPGD